jgi:hypothetical protein
MTARALLLAAIALVLGCGDRCEAECNGTPGAAYWVCIARCHGGQGGGEFVDPASGPDASTCDAGATMTCANPPSPGDEP